MHLFSIRRLLGLREKPLSEWSVSLAADGFEITHPKGDFKRVQWGQVARISTYKQDCYVYDMIVVELEVGDQSFRVTEADAGWSDFCEAMQTRFSSIPGDWYQQVMFPPFETNFQVLWSRQA
ncbi:MAG: hypothetical protein AAF078_00730 [Planctomycetota bacterium]